MRRPPRAAVLRVQPSGGPRRFALSLSVTAAVLAAASPAHAVQSVQKFSAKASPSRAGTTSKPRAVSLRTRAYFDDIAPDLSRGVQFATVNAHVFLSRDGITNNRRFPSCAPATIQLDEGRCPSGSRVGTGSGRGIGLGLDEQVKVQIFNAPRGAGITMLIVGESPLIIREVVIGKLTTLRGDKRYRYRISFQVPRNLQSPAPGVIAAVKDFQTTIPVQYLKRRGRYVKERRGRRKGQRIPYIATTGCTGGRWYAKFVAEYTTSFDSAIESSQTVETSQRCLKAKRARKRR